MKNSDVELIRRTLDGDDTAFTQLVRKYQKPVHALVWRKIGDFHIAEEITQDTFLKAFQKLPMLKEPQSFASWLYVIAARLGTAWLRKKRLWMQPLEDIGIGRLEKATYSGYVVEENERTAIETQREVVKKLLAKLQESDRTIITLRYFGEMSSAEIGKFLGVSANTIRSRLRRAQQRLREEEPMIREALENFKITPNLTENIMREISRLKPVTPSSSKPLVPWTIGVSTLVVVFLMLGVGNQYLSRFQKPYSFDAASEMTVELIEAPVVLDLEFKPDVRTQLGSSTASGKSSVREQQPDVGSVVFADAKSDETSEDYTQWELPKEAKARLGKGGINVIQFSPDSTQLAVGSNIGIWLYDVATGEEKSLFMGGCRSLTFSPDGRFLANGGGSAYMTTVELWEVSTGREVLLPDVYDSASVLRFSSDGKMLVSVSGSGDAIISLDVETGKVTARPFTGELFDMSDLGNAVYAITRGKVAIGRKDGKIQLWDITAHKELSTLRGHIDLSLQSLNTPPPRKPSSIPNLKKQVLTLAFSPDGTRLASGSRDRTVRLWDLTGKDEWITLQKHTGWTNALAFSPNGKMLASGSTDKTVQLWDTATGEPLATFTGHRDGITAVAFSPDGSMLASSSADGMIRFWQTKTGAPLAVHITEHTQAMKTVTFFEDSSTLAGVAFNGVITFWDVKTLQKSQMRPAGPRDWFPTLAFSPDGAKLVSVGAEATTVFGTPSGYPLSTWRQDHLIRLTDVSTGRELASLPYSMGIEQLTFSPDGKMVAFSGLGEIRLWNTETSNEQAIRLADLETDVFDIPRVTALGFSPDGTRLVSGNQDGKIQMWDVATGGTLTTFAEPTAGENLGRISAVAFSPEGTLLAAGAHNQVHLWEVDTGNTLFSLNTEHTRGSVNFQGYPKPLVFSPDGAVLVNGLSHGAIQLWDVTTGNQIAVLDGHTHGAETLKFSPDGKTLASTAMDGIILLWDWDGIFKNASGSDE